MFRSYRLPNGFTHFNNDSNSVCKKHPQMHLNTLPTSFEGLRGFNTSQKYPNPKQIKTSPETTARHMKIHATQIKNSTKWDHFMGWGMAMPISKAGQMEAMKNEGKHTTSLTTRFVVGL